MKFIIDSNIIISALIKDSKTREIILKSGFDFYHPSIAIRNLNKYKKEIIRKAHINDKEFDELLKMVLEKVYIINEKHFIDKIEEAKEIIGKIDLEDIPFLALALSIPNNEIWTEDSDFEKQDKIKVWKTENIVKLHKGKLI